MSKFYGTINESARRTVPTARGHHSIGTTAASWEGCIKVRLWEDHTTGDICLGLNKSPGTGTEFGRSLPMASWAVNADSSIFIHFNFLVAWG